MSYVPTTYETALWSWLDAAVGGDVDDIRFANQPFAVGGKTVVTLQVLQVTQEMTPSRRLTVIDRLEEIESAYTGTVSVQVFGPNHRAIAQTIVRSLWRDDIGRKNTANGIQVRGEVGGIQDLSALIATDYLARSGVDFTFSFREIWTADEASAAITAAAATGMDGTALVEQFKRIAAALRGESTVTVGASVSRAASATIEGASTVSVGATVRVPVAVQCVGSSAVTVGAMARRIAEATCAGASTVLVGGMVRRLAKVSPIIGASGVEARAEVAHNMEHIKRIFGESDILLLVASDGAGALADYVSPGWTTITDTTETSDIPAISDAFYPDAVQALGVGYREYSGGEPLKTFSVGIFAADVGAGGSVGTRSLVGVNNVLGYVSSSNRMMIRNNVEAINHTGPINFADWVGPDFLVWCADEAAGEMSMHASGGAHTVTDYPSDMTADIVRLVYYGSTTDVPYKAQFWIVLNRLMTPAEIAEVRALL